MKSQENISIFISSPSDVQRERAIVLEIINDVNSLKGNSLGYEFKPITWEDDVLPTLGASPQEIIDKSVGDKYDVFLGIMSTKFGTPTKTAGSGTEHEFKRAYSRKVANAEEIELLFYFQEPGFSGKSIDVEELGKVQKFKSGIADKGLFVTYTTESEFKTKVTSHLAKLMDKIVVNHNRAAPATPLPVTVLPKPSSLFDPMSILNTLEDEDEQGFFEISESAINSLGLATEHLGGLSDAIKRLGDDFTRQNTKNSAQSSNEKLNRTKEALKAYGRSMDSYVETSEAILPLFHRHLAEGLQFSRELIIIASQDNIAEQHEIDQFQESLVQMRYGMESGLVGIVGLSEIIGSLPRATTPFNRSKKRAKAVIDGIIGLVESAVQEVDDINLTMND